MSEQPAEKTPKKKPEKNKVKRICKSCSFQRCCEFSAPGTPTPPECRG